MASYAITVNGIDHKVESRDPALDEPIGRALLAGPGQWQAVKRLRRDPHDAASSCWLHTEKCCFSA